MMADHVHNSSCTSCGVSHSVLAQTISELEFERGLWQAAIDGSVERVRELLLRGDPPDIRDTATYTPLHYASRNGHLSVTELLLNCGATVNVQTTSGATPLHRAAYCGHVAMADLLLRSGANPHLCDSDGKIALHKAAEGGHTEVVRLLLDRSSQSDTTKVKDNRMKCPVDYVPQAHPSKQLLLELLS